MKLRTSILLCLFACTTTETKPASSPDAGVTNPIEAVEAGADCVFNQDCDPSLRCSACDAGYCFCEPGARGAGKNGVDTCDSGDQCESALCVEGPSSTGESYCSADCSPGHATCAGMLPKCVTVSGLGSFCAR